MSNELFDLMCMSLYGSYVNISRKYDVEPISYKLFKVRLRIWEW